MIQVSDKVFHLSGENYSYLFAINPYGQPEQLHFGPKIRTGDADAFRVTPGPGWGASVLLREGDTGSCADDKPLEWSGSGRGDYRESPLELSGVSTDLRYVSHQILEGTAPMDCGLPQAQGGRETLEITLEQPGLRVKLCYTPYETALTRRTVVENTGSGPVDLGKCMSYSLDIFGSYTMASFHGGWIAEMRREDTPVAMARVVNESLTGASSNRNNPGFLLYEAGAGERFGRVYGFNLIYSGNHYSSAQQSLQGLTRVMQGVNPSNFRISLAPGEKFETPEGVLTVTDGGFGGLSENFHRFVLEHIIPKYWRGRPRPVLYNNWEGTYFGFDHKRLVDLAKRAKDLGVELFVLDDGWFGKRNDDKAGLGDYTVNKKKLPQGLEGLANKIRSLGMDFGIWVEPESVNPDSDLYRAHPDWVLRDEHPDVLGRNQLLLDLTRKEVRDYIVDNVSRIIDTSGAKYVKWDMNRHSPALGAKAHSYILGLYEVLGRIFRPRPTVLLESCSSGGNRFDLGMLCFSPQIWASDDTDPIERLTIQGGLSMLYPQSSWGSHVSAAPHHQTMRPTPLATRGNVAFFGCLGYELDLKHLTAVEVKEVKGQIAFYKQYRQVFQYGAFRRTDTGWQVSAGRCTLAGVFHKRLPAAPGYQRLRLEGLEPDRVYKVSNLHKALRIGPFGGMLNHVSPVRINPNGVLLNTVDKFFAMPDGAQELTASGAALMSGVMLKPLFRGTGYDMDQRTQLDFGSDIYIAERED